MWRTISASIQYSHAAALVAVRTPRGHGGAVNCRRFCAGLGAAFNHCKSVADVISIFQNNQAIPVRDLAHGSRKLRQVLKQKPRVLAAQSITQSGLPARLEKGLSRQIKPEDIGNVVRACSDLNALGFWQETWDAPLVRAITQHQDKLNTTTLLASARLLNSRNTLPRSLLHQICATALVDPDSLDVGSLSSLLKLLGVSGRLRRHQADVPPMVPAAMRDYTTQICDTLCDKVSSMSSANIHQLSVSLDRLPASVRIVPAATRLAALCATQIFSPRAKRSHTGTSLPEFTHLASVCGFIASLDSLNLLGKPYMAGLPMGLAQTLSDHAIQTLPSDMLGKVAFALHRMQWQQLAVVDSTGADLAASAYTDKSTLRSTLHRLDRAVQSRMGWDETTVDDVITTVGPALEGSFREVLPFIRAAAMGALSHAGNGNGGDSHPSTASAYKSILHSMAASPAGVDFQALFAAVEVLRDHADPSQAAHRALLADTTTPFLQTHEQLLAVPLDLLNLVLAAWTGLGMRCPPAWLEEATRRFSLTNLGADAGFQVSCRWGDGELHKERFYRVQMCLWWQTAHLPGRYALAPAVDGAHHSDAAAVASLIAASQLPAAVAACHPALHESVMYLVESGAGYQLAHEGRIGAAQAAWWRRVVQDAGASGDAGMRKDVPSTQPGVAGASILAKLRVAIVRELQRAAILPAEMVPSAVDAEWAVGVDVPKAGAFLPLVVTLSWRTPDSSDQHGLQTLRVAVGATQEAMTAGMGDARMRLLRLSAQGLHFFEFDGHCSDTQIHQLSALTELLELMQRGRLVVDEEL